MIQWDQDCIHLCVLRSFHQLLAAALVGIAGSSVPVAIAQKDHHDPLTEAQVDKIREAGIDPNERIKLYTEFTNDHVNVVKSLTNRGKSEARGITSIVNSRTSPR